MFWVPQNGLPGKPGWICFTLFSTSKFGFGFDILLRKFLSLPDIKQFTLEKFNQIKELIGTVEQDAEQFYNKGNNKAAGTRVRNGMQKLKVLAGEIRAQVTELKNKDK